MTYFLGLSGSAGFLGRPLPGTLRMASRADSGYMASLVKGLIPAVSRRLWAVLYDMPSFSAISNIVNPLIVTDLLSVKNAIKLSKSSIFTKQILSILIKKINLIIEFFDINIAINLEMFDIYYR